MGQELHQLFLQSVTINDKKMPREWVVSTVYVEKSSLKAPLLKIEVRDATGTVVDDWKAKYGAVMIAEMGDPQGNNTAFKTSFFITSATQASDIVTIIAVSEDVRRFKIPSPRTNLHTNKTPNEVFKHYIGELKLADGLQKRSVTYHLSAGEKPSKMLAEMARDKGCLCWTCRGEFYFSGLADLVKQKPAFTYEANNPKAERTISKLSFINQDHAATAQKEYRFVGYSMTDGYIASGDDSLPVRYISDADMETLRNMQLTLVPKLDIEVQGNPAIRPGMLIEILIHRYDEENQLNESLPQRMIVKNVAHFEDRVGYTTRMILGVPNQ